MSVFASPMRLARSRLLVLHALATCWPLLAHPAAASHGSEDPCENWQAVHPEWLFCDSFETGGLSEWIDETPEISVISDPDKVHTGGHAAQLRYTQGGSAGWAWKKILRPDSAAKDAQYLRWWSKWQPGFQWFDEASGDQKIFMLQGLEPQDAWAQTASWKIYVHTIGNVLSGQGVGVRELFLDRFIWDGTSPWSGQWQGFAQQLPHVEEYDDDEWECTEVEVVHNTPGQPDGALRVWINDDDQPVMEYTGVKFRDEAVSWNAIQLSGYYGGSGSPQVQHHWVDDIVVSSQRIGCFREFGSSAPLVPALPVWGAALAAVLLAAASWCVRRGDPLAQDRSGHRRAAAGRVVSP